jgi:hypothetical protein
MNILAIDPGPIESAFVLWDGERVLSKGKVKNARLLETLNAIGVGATDQPCLVIEQVASYGMAVGKDVFETVFWSGRFAQKWLRDWKRVPRKDVKMHLCGTMRAKDSNIRQALIDRFGKPGVKAAPNTIYGEDGSKEKKLRADEWQALALAVTAYDLPGEGE